MKLIKQSYYIITEKDTYKLIELAGRTAYKSEDKITDDSAEKFCQKIFNSKHWSVLEHSNIIFQINLNIYDAILSTNYNKFLTLTEYNGRYLVSGNIRAWLDFFDNLQYTAWWSHNRDFCLIYSILSSRYPIFFINQDSYPVIRGDKSCKLPRTIEFEELSSNERVCHHRISVRFITPRSLSHEIVRHRTCSFTQESTRYCTYKTGCTYIIPEWTKEIVPGNYSYSQEYNVSNINEFNWFYAMLKLENIYKDLLTNGLKPQQARGILPNDLKTEIVVTANLIDWNRFFNLRISSGAHPQMVELVTPLYKELKQSYPNLIVDL